MKIWSHTNSTPQHIGNTGGDIPLVELIADAHKARHATIRVAAYIWDCGKKCCGVFDSVNSFEKFKTENPHLAISDFATVH